MFLTKEPYTLPPKKFIGRDGELEEIKKILVGNNVIIHGTLGNGKTEFIRQLSLKLEKEIEKKNIIFKNIIIVEYQDNIKTSLVSVFSEKLTKEHGEKTLCDINHLFSKIVNEYLDNRETLLIIDNIRHRNQIEDLINNKIIQVNARILISSNIDVNLDNFINYKLSYLKESDYADIFYNNYKNDKIRLKLKEIINVVSDNICSIILFARYAKENKISVIKLLPMITSDWVKILLKDFTETEVHILNHLSIIEKLKKREKVGEKSNSLSNNIIDRYNSEIIENVDKLVRLGWVSVENDIYFIPTPLKEIVKNELNLRFIDYKDVIIAVNSLLEAFDVKMGNLGRILEYIKIAKNLLERFFNEDSLEIFNLIKIVAKIYEDIDYNNETLNYYKRAIKIGEKIFGKETLEISKLYDSLSLFFRKNKNYQKSIEWTKKTINIIQKDVGEKSIEFANKYNSLGECYIELNNYEKALPIMNKALKIRKSLLGDNSDDTIKNYNNIGIIYQELGDYSKALKYYKKTLEIKESFFGNKRKKQTEKAITYNNIGVTYKYKNDYNKALDFFKKAIDLRKKVKEEVSIADATIYYNIGVLYYSKGKVNEALEMLIKAASLYKKILGNSEITASIYNDIANIYSKDKKNYKNALRLYLKAAFIYLKIEKNTHIKELYEKITKIDSIIADQEKNIPKIVKKGKSDKTSLYIDKILDEYRNIPNKNHRNISYIYNTLATLYYNKGKFLMAFEYYKKALSILEEFVTFHPERFSTINNIGKSLDTNSTNTTNDDKELVDFFKGFSSSSNVEKESTSTNEYEAGYEEAKDFFEKIAITNDNIGVTCNALGYYEEAIEHFEKALANSDSRMLLFRSRVYNNIGISLMYTKKYGRAIDCFNKALINTEDKVSDDIRLEIAETYNNIGVCYRSMSNPNKAIQFLNKALQIKNELLGEEDISNIKIINNLGVANTYLGEYKEAEKMFVKAIKICEAINPTHPDLKSLSFNLLNLYHKYIKNNNQNLNKYYKFVFKSIVES